MPTSRAKDLADFIAKQSSSADDILETGALQLPAGTTGERPTAVEGMLRYNSTLDLAEYYDGNNWKAIDSPPTITSISPDNFDTAGDTITVAGANFQSGATVKIKAADGSEFSASSVTVTNSSTISFDITSAMVADDNDPYDVIVLNTSGLSGTLAASLDFAPEPAWTVGAGSLASIYDSGRSSISITTGATSTESDATITYAVTTGSLPSGLSIASGTGTITGTASAVGSDTTSTFTLTATATDSSSNTTTNTRQYSIVVKAPAITSYTSTGSGTFSVPSGLTALDVLVIGGGAGGGGAGSDDTAGGGGGAGGLIYRPAFPVTPSGSISYSVGGGGGPSGNGLDAGGNPGTDSTFGTLTAKGGGGGGSYASYSGQNGGSGGGGATQPQRQQGGAGIQPQQPGDSGSYGFGNPGGQAANYSPPAQGATSPNAGGGGGAGRAGYNHNESPSAGGGTSKSYSISGSPVAYAGGGGGGGGNGAGGGGGAGPGQPSAQSGNGDNATANRGSGGGGANSHGNGGSHSGGSGGSGVIIVKY